MVPLSATPELAEKVLRKGGNCPEKWEIFGNSSALLPNSALLYSKRTLRSCEEKQRTSIELFDKVWPVTSV